MVNTQPICLHPEQYNKLREEHQLLAILRANGIESWEHWEKSIQQLKEKHIGNG